MSIRDPISDMLARIRNACLARHSSTKIPCTKMTLNIARVLQEEGFVGSIEEISDGHAKHIVLELRYHSKQNRPIITVLKRVSKPGLRVYSKSKDLPRVLGGIGIAVVSTSKGVMSDRNARKQKVGGEVLCYVW